MVNWSDFGTENWPNYSIHTATVKELLYEVYLHLEPNFHHTRIQKVHLSENNVNNLRLISDILWSKCGFCAFLWLLTIATLYFCQIPTKSSFQMQIVENELILHPKGITILVWCQIFVVKGILFIIQWFSQYIWNIP